MDEKLPDSVAIVSGGLDSTTLVYLMLVNGYTPHLLSFDYGQRHRKELIYATATAKTLGLKHNVIDLTSITHLISNSALTSEPRFDNVEGGIAVPEGHYAQDNMALTVVPNRNMIMLSIAAGVAVNNKYRTIGVGVHAGDHAIYPDCRPQFIFSAGRAILDGNEGFHNFTDMHGTQVPIFAPFIDSTKEQIAVTALNLGVPLHMTWSCYKGGAKHCGRCGTCVERLEAIDGALEVLKGTTLPAKDETEYEDTEFWRTAVRG